MMMGVQFMEWFDKWPQLLQIATIVSLVGLAYIAIKNGLSFTLGKFGLSFNRFKQSSSEDDTVNPHHGCPNFDDLYIVITKLTILLYEKATLETGIELLRKQMDYAEMIGTKIIGMVQKMYLDLLDKKNGGIGVIQNHSYLIYRLILVGFVRRAVEAQLRCYFKKDRLIKASDSEYRYEREQAIMSIIQVITNVLNDEYFYTEDITREELFQLNTSHVDRIKSEFENIFDEARKMAKEYQERKENLNNQLASLMSRGKSRGKV